MEEIARIKEEEMQVLYSISHDLRSPLNSVLGLTQLINFSRERLNDEHKEYVDRIYQVTSDALNMINNMIDAYNLDQSNFVESLELVNVLEVISSKIQNYHSIAKIKNIKILFNEAALQPVEILTDKLLLSRVIENLLSNAIKFSQRDKKIYVDIKDKKDKIEFSVHDEGPGISPPEIQLLYKKFQRLSIRSTAGETTASLGLYVVKTMIEKMNGEIACESIPRKGTKFIVTIFKNTTKS